MATIRAGVVAICQQASVILSHINDKAAITTTIRTVVATTIRAAAVVVAITTKTARYYPAWPTMVFQFA